MNCSLRASDRRHIATVQDVRSASGGGSGWVGLGGGRVRGWVGGWVVDAMTTTTADGV